MSTLTTVELLTIRQPLEMPKKLQDEGLFTWVYNLIASFFTSQQQPGLFDSVYRLSPDASYDVFQKYVSNLALDLEEVGKLEPSQVEQRSAGIRSLGFASIIEDHARRWMEQHKDYDYAQVDATFLKADQLRAKMMGTVTKGSYTVPDAPLRDTREISVVNPGMVNKGNTCYLASLFQGLFADPICRDHIINAEFRLDPQAFGSFNEKDLQNFVSVLKACAIEFDEATRTGSTTAFHFLDKLRLALDPLVTNINLLKDPSGFGYPQHDPSEILVAIMKNILPDGNPLFNKLVDKKVFDLKPGQDERLTQAAAATKKFHAAILDWGKKEVLEDFKEYLRFIAPTAEVDKLNTPLEALKAILHQFYYVSEEEYTLRNLTSQEADLKKHYSGKKYEERVAKIKEEIAVKVEENQKLIQDIMEAESEGILIERRGIGSYSLLEWLQREIESRLDAPTLERGEWKNSLTSREEAVFSVKLSTQPDSNAVESYIETAFFEEQEDGYCDYYPRTQQAISLPIKRKEFQFEATPQCLFMQLCRNNNALGKDHTRVHLGETFYLDPDFTGDGRGGEYEVRWVSVHLGGGANGGHYIHYRKCNVLGEDKWYCFNDGSKPAEEANLSEVEKALGTSCLLFATRIDNEIPAETIKRLIAEKKEDAHGKDNERRFQEALQQSPDAQEATLTYLFEKELSRPEPNRELLTKIYLQLIGSEFGTFVQFFLPLSPGFDDKGDITDQLHLLKGLVEKYFHTKVSGNIVQQYISIREQRRAHQIDAIARRAIQNATLADSRRRIEKFQEALYFENACLDHIMGLIDTGRFSRQQICDILKLHSPELYQKYTSLRIPHPERPTFRNYFERIQKQNERLVKASLEKLRQAETAAREVAELKEQIKTLQKHISQIEDGFASRVTQFFAETFFSRA